MIEVYKNPWFKVVKDGQYHYIEEENSRNGAVILPFLDDQLVLVEVYRPAQQQHLLEAPRGYGNPGETSLDAALRELAEETGFKAQAENLTHLGQTRPNSAILTACIDLYSAQLKVDQQVDLPDHEVERLHYFPSADLPSLLTSGRIQDGFTLAAIALYWADEMRSQRTLTPNSGHSPAS